MREIMITLGFYNKELMLSSEIKLLNNLGAMLISPDINPADELEYRIIMMNLINSIYCILNLPSKFECQKSYLKIEDESLN